MKIGIYGGTVRRGAPLTSVVDEVVQMEERGFTSYWFPQVNTYDVLTVIALAGQRTQKIEMGTAVVSTYPRHPNVLAQQAATANALCDGRLTLGVGPSHKPGIEDGLGLRYVSPASHTREYVTILRALANEGRVDFHGEHFNINTAFAVPEAKPFGIVMSALAPLMLKAAGEVADGTVTWMVGRNTLERNTVPRITEAARNAGRDDPRVIVGLPLCVHDDRDQAIARAVQIFRHYTPLPNYRRQLDAEGLEEAGEIAVAGNEQQVTDQLQAYFDAGATDVVASVYPTGDDGKASFQRSFDLLQSLL